MTHPLWMDAMIAYIASRSRHRKEEMKTAIEHYEAALKKAFPSGATGDVFHHWNEARKALEQPAREWVGLTEEDYVAINASCLTKLQAAASTEVILREKNT